MQTIPIQPVPAQIVKVVLEDQNVQIGIYQKVQGIFVDVNVDGTDVVTSVIAHDTVPLVCRDYAGFLGNLIFVDNLGSSDPTYDLLGTRYSLVYLTEEEYALI